MKTIDVAKDFSRYPAGRYLTDGPYSGQLFRERVLIPALSESRNIAVILDGTRGYGSSFLEEAFGGLVRSGYDKSELLERIKLQTKDEFLLLEIKDYINSAKP